METEPMRICGEHSIPMMYRGNECPWCHFVSDAIATMEKEYKRGFADGVNAAEADNAKRSDDSKG